MKVVKIFSVNEQVQHVVALTTDLETHLHPVQGCCLKELGGFERSEQISEKDKNIFKLHILRSNQIYYYQRLSTRSLRFKRQRSFFLSSDFHSNITYNN